MPTQSKSQDFRPRRGVRGGHLQTLASFFLSRKIDIPGPEDRMIEVEKGIGVLCRCHWQKDRSKVLTVIVVHGLEGSSESKYMLGMVGKGLAAGMNVIRMNQRSCGVLEQPAPTLYHSGLSSDVAAVARSLIATDQVSRLALVGFSMGGNLVLKLAGEWGREGSEQAPSQFRAVAAVCPAIDLAASADALHRPGNRIYEQYFLWRLRRSFRMKASLFPDRYDASRLPGIRSLREFDDRITAYYCGFQGASDYYARAAAANVVDQISVPAFILHAANDPFIRILPETRARISSNPNVRFTETADGGHCSFLSDRGEHDGYWAEDQLVRFLGAF